MKKEIKYLQYLLRHKWYVFVECFKSGLYWRGLIHDISKFSPTEFFPYANFFYGVSGSHNPRISHKNGYCKPILTGDKDFDSAWLNHCKKNKHHWQWWITTDADGREKFTPIPEPYLTEMLCDWVGAGKAQGHFSPKQDPYLNVRNWYTENRKKLRLAEITRKEIERRIGFLDIAK